MRSRNGLACALALLGLAGQGCATRQSVALECLPQTVRVWVDEQLIEGNPNLLELSRDEPHKVFVRAEGFEPQLVVLESVPGDDGELQLTPANLCIELVPLGQGRQLEVELEDAPPAR